MRWSVLALVVATAIGVTACGGGEEAAPLTLEQRLLLATEAPGAEPDPVETREEAGNLDQFMVLREYVVATQIDRSEYEDAGFVSAIHDTRFYPKEPGGEHTGHEPHVRLLVIQFESDEGAETAIDLLHDNGTKPCPGTCATRTTEFDVDGPPDAKGVRRLITAEALKETGEQGEPFDAYAIRFSDGRFAYEVEVFGAPGAVSEEQIEGIAQKLYDRVEGAPPPDG